MVDRYYHDWRDSEPPKFKKGDKVVVIGTERMDRIDHIKIGDVGVIIEESHLPRVLFDYGWYSMYEFQLALVEEGDK